MASDVYKVVELTLQVNDVVRCVADSFLRNADVLNHQTRSLSSSRCHDRIEPLSDFPEDRCSFRISTKLSRLVKIERRGKLEPVLLHLRQLVILEGAKLHQERPPNPRLLDSNSRESQGSTSRCEDIFRPSIQRPWRPFQ